MFRVFLMSVGWSEVVFIIDSNISFKSLLDNPQTCNIKKTDFKGEFEFDAKFLEAIYASKYINGYKYYFRYMHDEETTRVAPEKLNSSGKITNVDDLFK